MTTTATTADTNDIARARASTGEKAALLSTLRKKRRVSYCNHVDQSESNDQTVNRHNNNSLRIVLRAYVYSYLKALYTFT